MKRLKHCWPNIVAFENLVQAYRKARKGKRERDAVAQFSLDLERELLQLQENLHGNAYTPGPYRQFVIYERKPRLIAAAPFRDRVVHHAVMNVVEPWLDRRFIHDSYACRRHKGVHRAVDRYQQWAQRYAYVMKLDIRRYFPSIDHGILKAQLARHIADKQTLELLETIISASPVLAFGKGIPIGNLTSQTFANLYLNGLDHFIKQQLACPAYLRYVDDLVLLADDKRTLWGYRSAISHYLESLDLTLHQQKLMVAPTTRKIDMFGFQVSRRRRWLRNDNGYAARKRFRRLAAGYADGSLAWNDIHSRVASWIGHARHGQTNGLRQVMLGDLVFQKKAL